MPTHSDSDEDYARGTFVARSFSKDAVRMHAPRVIQYCVPEQEGEEKFRKIELGEVRCGKKKPRESITQRRCEGDG